MLKQEKNMKICVLLAPGFEEVEALAPLDLMRRAGLDAITVSVAGREVTGSHGITVVADKVCNEVSAKDFDVAVFPGGMPGSLNLDSSDFTDEIIASVLEKGGRLAAICAAPLIFGRRGLLHSKNATCFPGFENELAGAVIVNAPVVTDGNITTANGMESALLFGKELVALLTK